MLNVSISKLTNGVGMDTDNNGQQPMTDDAELAKVLEGMNNSQGAPAASGLQFEEAALPTPDTGAADPNANPSVDPPTQDTGAPATDTPAPEETPATEAVVSEPDPPAAPDTVAPIIPEPAVVPEPLGSPSAASGDLENIKKDALEELRPLVDKLDLPADEKFDTLLLIIRSTDDQSLLSAAHAAAKGIEDETRRAQALLDVIKEIDYFANQSK